MYNNFDIHCAELKYTNLFIEFRGATSTLRDDKKSNWSVEELIQSDFGSQAQLIVITTWKVHLVMLLYKIQLENNVLQKQ